MIIYTDGASNRKNMGIAFVAYENKRKIKEFKKKINGGTNNIAEYMALIEALKFMKQKNKKGIIRTDSQLVARQLNGEYKVKDEKLKPLFEKAKKLSKGIKIEWIRRELNKEADRLSKKALED